MGEQAYPGRRGALRWGWIGAGAALASLLGYALQRELAVELAERRGLAADQRNILDADLLEGAQIAFHGANHAVSLFVRPRSRAICQRSSPAHLSSSIRSYRDGHVGSDDEQIAGSVKAC